jgi:hypothetical protein
MLSWDLQGSVTSNTFRDVVAITNNVMEAIKLSSRDYKMNIEFAAYHGITLTHDNH